MILSSQKLAEVYNFIESKKINILNIFVLYYKTLIISIKFRIVLILIYNATFLYFILATKFASIILSFLFYHFNLFQKVFIFYL